MILRYEIHELAAYINWPYFFHAWQLHDKTRQMQLQQEAEQLLSEYDGRYAANAMFQIMEANSDGDDIVLDGGRRLPLLRQQEERSKMLCLADFVRPLSSGKKDMVGLFATSVDQGMETDFDDDQYKKMMMQLLADRLAEAAAERMHQEVRTRYWGYAPQEQLTMEELHAEKFQGIRPAVGYPSLPDTSLNFVIDELLDMKQIGIQLTESGAMRPHASVSGLMISHPQSCYFSLGRIGMDQLSDYAARRGMTVVQTRKFLQSNL